MAPAAPAGHGSPARPCRQRQRRACERFAPAETSWPSAWRIRPAICSGAIGKMLQLLPVEPLMVASPDTKHRLLPGPTAVCAANALLRHIF